MSETQQLNIDLRQMILAIENAVSLVGMNDTNHGKRVAFIATQFAHKLGFTESELGQVFELGLLHDIGVSREQVHTALVNHFDWSDSEVHCEIGYRLLNSFKPLKQFAIPILHHHTHWAELKDMPLSDKEKLLANLIFISDRIDVSAASHYEKDILIARKNILELIASKSDIYFKPELVETFKFLQQQEAFWIALEDRHVTRFTWDMGAIKSNYSLSLKDLFDMSSILAYIVDQKSPFTAEHSSGVAAVARFLAESLGLEQNHCDLIEIAGLLHDLGKLHMPDHILEKPGKLNTEERSIMNQHSYETYEILRHVEGLEEIARWASFHHEGLNGIGYPFHPSRQELGIEARIIAVADVYQALAQDRPYRMGMVQTEILTILKSMAESGKLDSALVALAERLGDECYRVARDTSLAKHHLKMDAIQMLSVS